MDSKTSQQLQVDVHHGSNAEESDPNLRKNSPFTPPSSASSTSPAVSGWESVTGGQFETNPPKRLKVETADARTLRLQKLMQTYDVRTTKVEPVQDGRRAIAEEDPPTIESLQRKVADLAAELEVTKQKLREKEAESSLQGENLHQYLQSIGVRDEQLKNESLKSQELQDIVSGLKARLGPSFPPRPIPNVGNLLFSCRIGNPSITSEEHALKILEPREALEKLQNALELTKTGMDGDCSPQLKHQAEQCIRELEEEIETKFAVSLITGQWEYKSTTLEAQLLDIIKRRKRLELEEDAQLSNRPHQGEIVS